MKKTGNPYLLLLLSTVLIAALPRLASAGDIEVQASLDAENVEIGGHVTLHIEVISDEAVHVEHPAIPRLSGVRFVTNSPDATTRQRVINGQPKVVYRFAYEIQGMEEGLVAIPAIPVRVDGEQFHSNELDIRVTESGSPPPSQQRHPEIFLQKELSEKNPVRGQQVTADIVIYYRDYINLNNYQIVQGWNSEGFWQEDMSDNHRARAETIFLDGTRYRRAVLMRHAVFPTRAETITVQPYKINANVRARPRHGESEMFGSGGGNRDIELQTEPVTMNVNDLPRPQRGKFINAVGELEVERYLNSGSIKIGESVEVITEVSGPGNLGLLGRPDYNFPNGFDTFQAREELNLDKTGQRVTGSKVYRDVLISRRVGSFTVPAAEIAVFNTITRSYDTIELPELELRVDRNPNAQIGYNESEGFRMTPERTVSAWLQPDDQILAGQWWFWAGLILPFFILIGSYNYYRYQRNVVTDKTLQRKNSALKSARQLLREAQHQNSKGEVREAYALISRTLQSFITDKLNIPKEGYTTPEIMSLLQEYLTDSSRKRRLETLLLQCEEVRYKPNSSVSCAEQDINKAEGLLNYLNRVLK